ncbi:hypothetical protein M9H77_20483 [Catharanthus roseus]|uniref:Uncharacterized protein n=1 Tax=Catharanthus roseus TaxID=4058 RepID=A0ACC0ALL5_CATRO|nr:hypothetical protein M9H77_20483 [Catharanthus roseus]
MMEEQENCTRITRASKKRPFGIAMSNSSIHQNVAVPTKRVALGDLTNVPTAAAAVIPSNRQDFTGTKKPKAAHQVKKKTLDNRVEEIRKPEIDVEVRHDDPLEYADAPLIYWHLRMLEVEENRRPQPNYMEKVQRDITPTMREILVDWLVEVADEYKLVSDTLHLTVDYIDRFLSSHTLSRTKLQLLGVSSMLVASKFEEINPPRVEEFCYMTDNTYTKEEVVNMELDVLKFLNYDMGNPTARTFIRIFMEAAQDNPAFSSMQFQFLACYIAELSLVDYTCMRFLPSMIAASSIFLARITMLPHTRPWTLALQQFTGYASYQLKECVLAIHHQQCSSTETSRRAVKEKYMEHKFKSVAALCPPSQIPHHYFE